LADWSAKPRRVERRVLTSITVAHFQTARRSTLDGDKSPAESGDESPHSKGFAVGAENRSFKQALRVVIIRVVMIRWPT
jgi:hypothetical protein